MSRKKPKVPRYTPISKHKLEKGQLTPPLSQLGVEEINWHRDLRDKNFLFCFAG